MLLARPSTSFLCLVACTSILIACSGEPTIGTLIHEDAARPRPRALEEPARDETLIAVDAEGVVRLVDATRLAIGLGVRAGEDGAVPIDLSSYAEDGELRRLAVLTQSDPEGPVDVAVFPFTGQLAARPRVARRFEGFLRVLALEEGALVFQRGEAFEWNLVPMQEERPRSKQCPMPTSVLAVEDHDGATHVLALARSAEDTPVLARGVVEDGALARCEVSALDAGLSEAARLVRLEGVDFTVDVRGGELSIGRLSGPEQAPTGLPFGRVEAVVPLEIEGEPAIAALGSEPARLAVVWLDLQGEGEELVLAAASEQLAGPVEQVYAGFQRSVAFAGGRVFVATAAGLQAFEPRRAPATLGPISLPAPVAALRGPLASAPALEAEENSRQ